MVEIPPRIEFSKKRNVSGSVMSSNSAFEIFKAQFHAKPGTVQE